MANIPYAFIKNSRVGRITLDSTGERLLVPTGVCCGISYENVVLKEHEDTLVICHTTRRIFTGVEESVLYTFSMDGSGDIILLGTEAIDILPSQVV